MTVGCKMSVTVNNNSPIQDGVHLDEQTQPTSESSSLFIINDLDSGTARPR